MNPSTNSQEVQGLSPTLNTQSSPPASYEHPLNERLRLFLRLEFLFHQMKRHSHCDSLYEHHVAIVTLVDILQYIGQQDIKKEALKELDRISLGLNALKKSPKIELEKLNQILDTIRVLRGNFRDSDGAIGKNLRQDEFIKVLLQRSTAPGGFTLYDPPVYSYWLRQSSEQRSADLNHWFSVFNCLDETVDLVLGLVRESAIPHSQLAHGGVYHQSLDSKTPYQMICVTLPSDSTCYAEISGGKHRFTVRFFDTTTKPRPMATTKDIQFDISCCIL